MDKLDKVILALRCHYEVPGEDCIDTCPYNGMGNCLDPLMKDCLEVLRGRYDLEIQLDVAREKLNILRAELAEERERSARWLRESEPVVHAHWVIEKRHSVSQNPYMDDNYHIHASCSNCGFVVDSRNLGFGYADLKTTKFCSECGAHMDEEVDTNGV